MAHKKGNQENRKKTIASKEEVGSERGKIEKWERNAAYVRAEDNAGLGVLEHAVHFVHSIPYLHRI